MKTKVLVCLKVPEVDKKYDVYLPISKTMGNIVALLNEYICEITHGELAKSPSNLLYNADTNEKYSTDVLLYHTNIRNGTNLILISK